MSKHKTCYKCNGQEINKTLVDLPYFNNITVTGVPANQCQFCFEIVLNVNMLQDIEDALGNKIVKKNTVSFSELLG